ncbi:Fpg/Nei family DNA glycosylase [Microbacterium lushaniae]|nr:Fpg/Nei family DNA glycosylase [Microbacterium lushaniae]KAA9147442.1 Fpg/Nei family DNA glycosylase [Microbacterium lushaniae]
MPESPEVDALAAFLRDTLHGARVGDTDLAEFRTLKTRARPPAELSGHVVTDVRRYGKHIALVTDAAVLVISFGRAGWARWLPVGAAAPADPVADAPPAIATIDFPERGALALTDAGQWLSIGVSIVDEPADVPAIAKLGPDPTADDWSRTDLERVLGTRRKQVKALLQEQESLAGIGNAYSDEILFVARISPPAHAADLTPAERDRLYDAIRSVLGEAFAARRGVPPERQKADKVASMRVHGRTGQPCPTCGGEVADVPGSKGTAQYCPACQTGGVPQTG